MKWFEEVFLPSLETQYHDRGGNLWLTRKQADVCRNYMTYGHIKGFMYYDIEDKKYCLQIAPNGCGKFNIMINGWQSR